MCSVELSTRPCSRLGRCDKTIRKSDGLYGHSPSHLLTYEVLKTQLSSNTAMYPTPPTPPTILDALPHLATPQQHIPKKIPPPSCPPSKTQPATLHSGLKKPSGTKPGSFHNFSLTHRNNERIIITTTSSRSPHLRKAVGPVRVGYPSSRITDLEAQSIC